MEAPHCSTCNVGLEPDDGHDNCHRCLGLAHLREALGDNACMNCSYMPMSVRVARLAELEDEPEAELPSAQTKRSKRPAQAGHSSSRAGVAAVDAPPSKKKKKAAQKSDDRLGSKVDRLTAELAQMRALLMAQQPEVLSEEASTPSMPLLEPEEDVMSLAASATHFHEEEDYEEGSTSQASVGSCSSDRSSLAVAEDSSMREILRTALERLNVSLPHQAVPAPASAFYRRRPPPTAFTVPHSEDFLRELQASWTDTKAGAHLSVDARALAAMFDAAAVGLDHMPAVEPGIASLIVAPDESLRQDTKCPSSQCRLTDDFLVRAYDSGARAGRVGNSLSHLMLALSASLQEGNGGEEGNAAGDKVNFCDAALEAFGHMSRELGRMMSYLVQARRQVWLSQSPLTEKTRKTLRSLPVEPGTIFGPAAQEALERAIQAGQTRQQLVSLQRMPPPNRPPSGRGRGRSTGPRLSMPPPAYTGGQHRFQRPAQGQAWGPRFPNPTHSRPFTRQFRAPDPGFPAPRAPRGRGARY